MRTLTFPASDFNCFCNNFIWIPASTKATTTKLMFCCFDLNHFQQINHRFHGHSLLQRYTCGKQTHNRLSNVGSGSWIVEVTTVLLVWRPDSELWEASHLPDSFPSSLWSHYPAVAWGPLTPAALSVSLFPLLLPFHYLSPLLPFSSSFSPFSLSPGSLCPVLSRAPCVTRMIKTNTDLILVSNPIVLFFFSPAPEHAEY